MENISDEKDEELVRLAGQTVVGTQSGLKAQHAQAELTRRLMNTIKDLNSSTDKYSIILIWLTAVLAIITGIQFYYFIKVQLPITQLEAQKEILGVIESCKISSSTKWTDQDGKIHDCSEMPPEWFKK